MRPSPFRHTLAVLRTTIGLTQKEMAALLECSTPTIQAIELGKLKMSDKLARMVLLKTGASPEWLAQGDPTAPPTDIENKPYTKLTFEKIQAELFHPSPTPIHGAVHLFEYWSLYIRAVEILSLAYTEAYKQDKTTILSYKCLMSLLDTIRECGLVSPELQKSVTGRQRFDGNPEVINEAASLAVDFAQATYATLRSTVKAKGKPLSPEDTKLFKAIDRSFHYKSPRKKTTSPTKR